MKCDIKLKILPQYALDFQNVTQMNKKRGKGENGMLTLKEVNQTSSYDYGHKLTFKKNQSAQEQIKITNNL